MLSAMIRKTYYRISILSTIFLFLLASTSDLKGQLGEGIEGIWLGTLKVGEMGLRIALTFSKSDEGIYSATMNSIDQSSGEIPMEEVVINRDSLLVKHTGIGIEETFSPLAMELITEWILKLVEMR